MATGAGELSMAETPRCRACAAEATHVVGWSPSRLKTHRGGWTIHRRRKRPLYCRWHATVMAVQRNAEGAETLLSARQGVP